MTTTFNYARALETANRLMDYFGQAGTIVIPGATSGDAWNPTTGSTTSEACVLAELEYENREIDGSAVLRGDKKLIIKAGDLDATLVPSATKITYGGNTYRIVGPVKPFNPAGTVLFWEAQARV